MKKHISIYIIAFLSLLAIFQYVNAKHIFDDTNKRLAKYKTEFETYKDSVVALENIITDLSYFNFAKNEDALSYFENKDIHVSGLEAHIKDELYKYNKAKGEHAIIPYSSSKGKQILINNIKLLNHKWIIADFSDGEFWGEIILNYQIDSDKRVTFTLLDSFLYPFD
ncbi:MAG: hydrolase [Aestuariibaculum sp.]